MEEEVIGEGRDTVYEGQNITNVPLPKTVSPTQGG